MFYSASKNAFYSPQIAYPERPQDLQELTDEEYHALVAGQADGKQIVPGNNGLPRLITPATSAPKRVTMRQARLALIDADKYNAVVQAIAQADTRTQVEWEFAATVERESPLVDTLAQALGFEESTLDALFTAAAKL